MIGHPDKNYIDNLVTLSEVVNLTAKHPDEILRMGASGGIQCYCLMTVEKIEVGALGVAPKKTNPDSVKYEERPDWCAISISPYLKEILEERPEYFSVTGEVFPQGMFLRLENYQIAGLLTRTTVFVKYGILPDGHYFKVVSSPDSLELRRENLFLHKGFLDLVEGAKGKEPSSETMSEKEPVKKSKQAKFSAVSVPEGTRWAEITIHFDDYEKVTIKIGRNQYSRTPQSLGFENSRTGKLKNGWKILFLMALYLGQPKEKIKNLSKKISDLNKALTKVFPGVEGNPFASYKEKIGWAPNLKFSLSKNLVGTVKQ